MARRSKVLKDLKNSLKFLPSIRNRFFDRVVLNKESGKEVQNK